MKEEELRKAADEYTSSDKIRYIQDATDRCENAKAWHEILLEDAEQFSRKLKEKELKNNNNHED